MTPVILQLTSFYFRFSRRAALLSIVIGLLAGAASSVLVAIIGRRISSSEATVGILAAAFVGIAFLDLTLNVVSGLLATRLSHRTAYNIRLNLCRKILDAPLRHLEETGNHRVLAALTQDIPALVLACMRIPQVCIHVAVVAGCLVYLGWLSLTLLGALVVFLVLAVLSVKLIERQAKPYIAKARQDWDTLVKHFQAMVEGAKELKLSSRRQEDFFADILQSTATSFRRNNIAADSIYAVLEGWGRVLYFVIIGLVLFALPGLGGTGVSRQILTGYALAVLFMESHISSLMVLLPILGQANVSLENLQRLGLSLETPESVPPADALLTTGTQATAAWKALELRGVTHTYYREKEDQNFVLGPIDLSIQSGQLVFIIGGNGSGKTTLVKLLTGLYSPESGEIRLNGKPITEENRGYHRQHFSVVFTDFYLFEQLLGLDAVNLDERALAYLIELQLEHKVKVADGKLSTTELSHGQRKRLALLIAYLEDRPIYVFDEWDSGQDPQFKEVFYLHLLPELKARGKTVIIVSHDERYFHLAERVIRLDYGKIDYDRQLAPALEVVVNTPAGIESS
jgi:putative ATP-binding cassette transporter